MGKAKLSVSEMYVIGVNGGWAPPQMGFDSGELEVTHLQCLAVFRQQGCPPRSPYSTQ